MKENNQCLNCYNYEYCTMRRDKDFCYEYNPIKIKKKGGK